MWFALQLNFGTDTLTNMSIRLASMTFTVYVVHFPLAAALSCIALRNYRYEPSIEALGVFLLALSIVLSYSIGIYFVAERNTTRFQKWLLRTWQGASRRNSGNR
jgi:peptidoglycan/LPS O-acetylase OafA/YrhL